MTDRDTNRWVGVAAVAFLAGGVGAVAASPAALLVAVVGVGYAAYGATATHPDPRVEVEYELSDRRADPGDEVAVTVTVTNEGSATLPDLRLIDGVPGGLRVVEGSPRMATALRPGKTATLRYVVEASRGAHEFGPATLVVRDASGAREREIAVGDGPTLECVPHLGERTVLPLYAHGTDGVGRVVVDSGGPGVEFYGVREYRRGDPLGRIDWNRHAKTGELATIDYREERSATVVVLVDARTEAYVGGDLPAIEHAIAAAGRIANGHLAANDRVGLASLGPYWTWIPPNVGRTHRQRLREALATGDGFPPVDPAEGAYNPVETLARLHKRLPADAQVVFCTPLADDYAGIVPRRLAAAGHAVTVVSPDVTARDTVGDRLAAVERDGRIHDLRRAGMRVLDWDPDRPLPAAVAEVERRWRS